METELKNKKMRLIQFWASCFVLVLYLILPFMRNLHEHTELSCFQIALGVLAILFGGIPFINAFTNNKKKWACLFLGYLLIMAAFGFLAYMAYLPILQDALASGVASMAPTLTHWVNVVSLVAFLSIFVVTAADSGFIQAQCTKFQK